MAGTSTSSDREEARGATALNHGTSKPGGAAGETVRGNVGPRLAGLGAATATAVAAGARAARRWSVGVGWFILFFFLI
jgi:hypothetical protein